MPQLTIYKRENTTAHDGQNLCHVVVIMASRRDQATFSARVSTHNYHSLQTQAKQIINKSVYLDWFD